MQKVKLCCIIYFVACFISVNAQQVPDINYKPPYFKPAYEKEKGPLVLIDEAHNNFHTATGRYSSFAELLKTDGFRVQSNMQSFTKDVLKAAKILVIANALHPDNISLWRLPTPSAFTENEIQIVNVWVKEGGSLFLIADHMPFAGAASDLAKSFGFIIYNGFAVDTVSSRAMDVFTKASGTLQSNEITNGPFPLDSIITFTGQAFDLPTSAVSILNLSERFKIYLCDQAWNFNDKTIKIEGHGKSQGAYLTYGKGKVAMFGEAAMFSAQLSGGQKFGMNSERARYNYKLLINTTRWLAN